jgi:hypothetical protein
MKGMQVAAAEGMPLTAGCPAMASLAWYPSYAST